MKRDGASDSVTIPFQPDLFTKFSVDIAKAAAYVVVIDMRPMRFIDHSCEGVKKHVCAIFKAGQL